MALALSNARIDVRIVVLRGCRVMISTDLAKLYGVEPRALVQAVKRNADRFPSDFMFQCTPDEANNLRSQSVISSWGGVRTPPYAFTQEGVAMLSSVLKSSRAVQVNIEIMRAFVRLRRLTIAHEDLSRRLDDLERQHDRHDRQLKTVFDAIRALITPPARACSLMAGLLAKRASVAPEWFLCRHSVTPDAALCLHLLSSGPALRPPSCERPHHRPLAKGEIDDEAERTTGDGQSDDGLQQRTGDGRVAGRHPASSGSGSRLENFDCYRLAVELATLAATLVPRGHASLRDQLERASTSVVLNISEGCRR